MICDYFSKINISDSLNSQIGLNFFEKTRKRQIKFNARQTYKSNHICSKNDNRSCWTCDRSCQITDSRDVIFD